MYPVPLPKSPYESGGGGAGAAYASPVCDRALPELVQGLNNQTIKDSHSLPLINNTLEAMHWSILDLKASNWQIPILVKDKGKLVFCANSDQLYE